MTTPLVTLTAAELCATAADDELRELRAKWKRDHAERVKLAAEHRSPPPPEPRRLIRRAPTLQVTGTTPEQQARWKDAAARQGMTLAAWMRAACEAFASSDT